MIQTHHPPLTKTPLILALTLALTALLPAHSQEDPPIVQPGAPGEPSRVISAEEASDLAGILWTEADVRFMQGMIAHHAQALEMTDLLETRTDSAQMRTLAERIELSQRDEIEMMQAWLRDRGRELPDSGSHGGHGGHGDHGADGEDLMPGMLTPAEMDALAQAEGVEFDRLFLEKMIAHHRGALVMVEDLLDRPGAAQESTIFDFTTDVVADQSAEIDRMGSMLADLSSDPRVGLAAGFRDAGSSLHNMELVAAIPKPPGFFSPDAPEGVPIPPEGEDGDDGEQEADEEAAAEADAGEEADVEEAAGDDGEDSPVEQTAEEIERAAELEKREARASILNFANSDLAFSGTSLFNGNFHGFSTYDVEDPANPRLLASVICPGGQGDVSVVGDLLIMSVEQTRGRLDCGLQGVAEPVSPERFRGIRVFDIRDLSMPRQVAAVQTCRGSHTHSVVSTFGPEGPGPEDTVVVYASGTSSVRSGEELEGCSDLPPGEDEETALFSIDVIEIPVGSPGEARVVNRPRIFADPESGLIAGLWRGGTHGVGSQRTAETNQCHDITVFPEKNLAAGACSGNGILLDISDPVNPVRLDQVTDEGFAYWHSATFNNDGTKVVFTDEWGGGMRPRCRSTDPRDWGANAIFDVVDGELIFRSYYKLPAPQSDTENCVAHNGSLVPVPGRDVMVQAWYQGGISVFDFTDSANPTEIAFFDRGPIDDEQLMMGGHWSAYWYDGHVYATEIARGLDVLKLLPSEHLTQNEIDAAKAAPVEVFNPQQQLRVEWPAQPAVARALLDQVERHGDLGEERIEELRSLLGDVEIALESGSTDETVSGRLRTMARDLASDAGDEAAGSSRRLHLLEEALRRLAEVVA